VTEVTRTGPAQLTLMRQSQTGFNALELIYLLRWFENPGFPGWSDEPVPARAAAGTGYSNASARTVPSGRGSAVPLPARPNRRPIGDGAGACEARRQHRSRRNPPRARLSRTRAWGTGPVEAALICEAAGAHGITAHLREDRRHIQDRDVSALRERIGTRLNLEMALAPEIIAIALRIRPAIVCLVPERREEVTTEGGLDVARNLPTVTEVTRRMTDAGIEVGLFVAPDPNQIEASARTGAQFVELHTGAYAEVVAGGHDAGVEIARLADGAVPGPASRAPGECRPWTDRSQPAAPAESRAAPEGTQHRAQPGL
jgi:pyridoxine 5'-phosphate synthase